MRDQGCRKYCKASANVGMTIVVVTDKSQQRLARVVSALQSETAGLWRFLQRSGGAVLLPVWFSLCLNNARSQEEDQLLVGGADLAVLEQIAQPRHVP